MSTRSSWTAEPRGRRDAPKDLCRAICAGLVREKQSETMQIKCLLAVKAGDKIEDEGAGKSQKKDRGVRHEEDEDAMAWDDVTGEELDPREVAKARGQEMEYVRQKKVWRKITRREAQRRGIKIIKTRWIDINKGDRWNPNYRSRFVGKEFNDGKEGGLFAATPPLEALKMLISDVATTRRGRKRKSMMINDVARAFFEAPVKREICIELPDEDKDAGDWEEDMVGILEMSLYGTRDAAANFQQEVQRFMRDIGFRCGKYNVCTFWHPKRDLKTMVHGDDFVTSGERDDLQWLKEQMEKRFEIKTQTIGHGPGDSREGKVLNRVLRATDRGWEYEADQRHGEIIVKTMGLSEARGVSTPGEDTKSWLEIEEAQPLEGVRATEYRALAARANYLALDRPDIQYATKEICRAMATPTVGDRRKLKRLARYLLERPRMVSRFDFQGEQGEVSGYSDSDWAGCRRTAKSTSGGAIMRGGHCLKTWSSTQKSITLSSGEAELVAAVKMSAEMIGLAQLLEDWGVEMEARVYVDSSAAIGIVQRKGNGKMRHVRVGMLWIQERVEDGDLAVTKVDGKENPADAMTKHLPAKTMDGLLDRMRQERRDGRASHSLETG